MFLFCNICQKTEAKTGYVLSFDIYTGKSASRDKSTSVCHSVVMQLLESYLGKDHWVFIDNYYNSPKLFAELYAKNVYGTGTVHTRFENNFRKSEKWQ